MNNYNSNPFNLKYGAQDVPGGAVFSNNSLIYGYCHNGKLCTITCSPPQGQDPWIAVSPATPGWQQYWKSNNTNTKMNPGLTTPVVCLPNTATGQDNIFVLAGDSHAYLLNQDLSVTQIQLRTPKGGILTSVGATAWGNYMLVAWWSLDNQLVWELFDPATLPSPISNNCTWTASSEAGGPPNIFMLPDSTFLPAAAFGPVASLDWVALDGNNFYLVTSFMPNNKGSVPNILVTPMGSGPLPTPVQIGTENNYAYPTLLLQGYPAGSVSPVTVSNDPAGRIVLNGCVNAKNILVAQNPLTLTVPSDIDPYDASSPWQSSSSMSQWQPAAAETTLQTPVTTWATGGSYNNGTTSTRMDIYQVTFFPDSDNHISCQIQAFGIAEQIPNAVSGSLLPSEPPCKVDGKTYTGVISGIFDAPFPMPASNIQSNFAQKYLNPGATLGTVTYGVTQESDTHHESNYSLGGGYCNQGEVTAGAGPAWNISVKAAKTWGSGSDTVVANTTNLAIVTEVNSTGSGVTPYGSVVANNVTYGGTYYRILDVSGNPMTGCGQACTIAAVLDDTRPTSFTPYLVTPGNLLSYTREQINLAAAGQNLVAPGVDYVANVIEANALQIGGGKNYLLWSQEFDNKAIPDYLNATDQWQETGWTLQTSDYVGISGGVGVSADGITVFSFTVESLVGVDLSCTQNTTTEESTQMQIQVLANIPKALQPSDISQMTVRIFFLPANAQWMKELAQCAGTQLNLTDTNSQPWRIFFLVDSFASVDGSVRYP